MVFRDKGIHIKTFRTKKAALNAIKKHQSRGYPDKRKFKVYKEKKPYTLYYKD